MHSHRTSASRGTMSEKLWPRALTSSHAAKVSKLCLCDSSSQALPRQRSVKMAHRAESVILGTTACCGRIRTPAPIGATPDSGTSNMVCIARSSPASVSRAGSCCSEGNECEGLELLKSRAYLPKSLHSIDQIRKSIVLFAAFVWRLAVSGGSCQRFVFVDMHRARIFDVVDRCAIRHDDVKLIRRFARRFGHVISSSSASARSAA